MTHAPDPAEEYALAQPPATPLWSENFALVFSDPVAGVAGLYSVGTWYRDTSVWRENLAVTLPGGAVLFTRNFGRGTCGRVVSAALSRFEVTEPGARARLAFDGPVTRQSLGGLLGASRPPGQTHRLRLALEFSGRAPPWDMHAGHRSDPTGVAGSMHIEQLGRCCGALRVDDAAFDVRDAFACRDHSRGARDVTQYRNHCWINGLLDGGRGFQLYVFRMHHIEGVALSLATVIEDGRHHPATVEHVDFVDGRDDVARPHTIVLRSDLGEMRIAVVSAAATIPVTMTAPFNPGIGSVEEPCGLIFDEPIRLEWNGRSGHGWCERGFSRQPLA